MPRLENPVTFFFTLCHFVFRTLAQLPTGKVRCWSMQNGIWWRSALILEFSAQMPRMKTPLTLHFVTFFFGHLPGSSLVNVCAELPMKKIRTNQNSKFTTFWACRTITHPFKLAAPNLDQGCITTWLTSLLFGRGGGGYVIAVTMLYLPWSLNGPDCLMTRLLKTRRLWRHLYATGESALFVT